MDTVYFYKFNNYYNRIIKRYDTLEEYGTPLAIQQDCNFVHGDGVNSTFTFNKALNINDTPDYIVVKDYNNKLSRWFVTNSFKTRDRQDKLALRRDLISDFYGDIVEYSPCLIRKGYVPQNNPLIFNDEGVQYNKIKQDERLIKDESNCSYIVGFFSNQAFASQTTVDGTIKDDNYDYNFADLNEFPYKNYVEGAGNVHSESATIIYRNSPLTRIYYSLKLGSRVSGNSRSDLEIIFSSYGIGKPSYYTPAYSTETGGTYYQAGSNNTNVIINCEYDGPGSQTTILENNYVRNNYI